MAELKDQISKEIIVAMKSKDKVRLNVLRYLKKLFIENDTAKKQLVEMDILISYAKKIKDSMAMYPDGSPQQDEVKAEVLILEEYLPKQLSEEEVADILKGIIAGLEAPNMGLIMKQLTPAIKGKFDGRKASEMVMAALNS